MTDPAAELARLLPGSKSLTQRALILAALADGPLTVRGAYGGDDARALAGLLRALGATVTWHGAQVRVQPPDRLRAPAAAIDCDQGGTTLRFGACLALLVEGELLLDGSPRLRQRPVAPLVEALTQLGVTARYLGQPGHPPLGLRRGAAASARARLDVSLSSQFASGLLLVAPRLPGGLTLELSGDRSSWPYLLMTVALLRRVGVDVELAPDGASVTVAAGPLRAERLAAALQLEPDWSSAAFLLGGAWLLGRELRLPGLPPADRSLQGDAVFPTLLAELGRPGPHRFDLRATPDLVPPLAVCALFAREPTRLTGVAHVRLKESDRLAVLASGLRQAGAEVDEEPDGLLLRPLHAPPPTTPCTLDPCSDHRMAMAFALLSLRRPGLTVLDPDCVSKSFPRFWEALATLRAVF